MEVLGIVGETMGEGLESRSTMFAEGEQLKGVVATDELGSDAASSSGDVGREFMDSSSSSTTELSGDEESIKPCESDPEPEEMYSWSADTYGLFFTSMSWFSPCIDRAASRSSLSSYSIGLRIFNDGW